MNEKSLKELAPGFFSDRDEDWCVSLPTDKQVVMRRERADFLTLLDLIETDSESCQKYARETKDDATTKASTLKRQRDHIHYLRKKKRKFIERVIPIIEGLKKDAIEAKKRALRSTTEQIRAESNKRLRFELDHDEDVDMEPDDYMPRSLPEQIINLPKPTPIKTDFVPTLPNRPTISHENDPLIQGLDPSDAEIIIQLRPLILQYNCLDRVKKAIKSFRARDKSLKALNAFTSTLEILTKKTN